MSLGRATLIVFVPTTVALYLWVLIAPGIYGVSGWGGVGVLFSLGPITVIFLLVVHGLVLASPLRPRRFTPWQTLTVGTLWAALALGGFVFEDAGDDTGSGPSVFTHLVGRTDATVRFGEAILVTCAGIVIVSAGVLLVQLVWALFTTRRPRR